MRQRTWVGVGLGVLVSMMVLGGGVLAAAQPQSQRSGRTIELPSVSAPEPLSFLQPLPAQVSTRGSLSAEQGQRLADGGESPVRCSKPKCP